MLSRFEAPGTARKVAARIRAVGSSLVVAAVLTGCSFVPNWANPVAWYDGAFGDEAPPPPQQAQTDAEGYPTLSSVPAVPQPPSTPQERQTLAEGLAADRDKARYTDDVLRGVPGAPPPPTSQLAAAPAVSLPPAPTPVPVTAPALTPPAVPSGAPAAAPYPQLALTSAPPAPPPAVPTPSQPAVTTNQSVLQQAFANGLAESAATVITTPTHSGFAASSSQPLPPQTLPVSELTRSNYNEALGQPAAAISQPVTRFRTASFVNGGSAIATIKFSNGSSGLSKSARSAIKGAAEAQKVRGGHIRIVGHASQRTRDLPIDRHKMVNFRLSVDRAQAVAKELMRHGIAPGSIVMEARGADDPIYYEWMPAGEAENRRADIYLAF
jgi:outer membrane protein OmpA-like peptidoglycan-associated protein